MTPTTPTTTDFGFESVAPDEKTRRVGAVFDAVAARYDLMNDLMSGGVHRLWKHFAVSQSGLHCGDSVLDVAAGSGDLTRRLARQVGRTGRVVMNDINPTMLAVGKRNMVDAGWVGNVEFVLAAAETLDEALAAAANFHCICIGFGLRNMTHKQHALGAMFKLLRPGGRLLVLEFSKPVLAGLECLYDAYSFNVIPHLGQWVAGDAASYRYLVESIRQHPPQEELATMLQQAGFEEVRWHNLSGGIVALHVGLKF